MVVLMVGLIHAVLICEYVCIYVVLSMLYLMHKITNIDLDIIIACKQCMDNCLLL